MSAEAFWTIWLGLYLGIPIAFAIAALFYPEL